ncbi:uncharacterized protein SPPG_04312 [Spizellomyces punctatus DAOM BR117]|uniref:Beta-catenin-like protein 1 N-terminal domain-containing protein n=1 Tax=Spizellomyces punctatus (strain DAOM BR117) TaxID=645134 RepID=A0A0L0HIF1_SPIPD|nr:uncharacterized protein SPPG_04312 [Spizellomyces punctatus DAOM BR117]KND01221.1 hypothetical protein SPPG_04312 [Spizellomyces punctatus DAOM BR117]|eukprot:XP_016609260.1 hypothetical protein SPPG_04312 [Spizellomyces punctatus DAOM BR117]
MNVDSIFKVPAAPVGKNKRKLPPTPDDAYLKKVRTDEDDDDFRAGWGPGTVGSSSGNGGGGELDGPVRDDDEDERFHESGLSDDQKKIWEIVDAGEEAPATIDLPTLKKMVLKFEKVINRNQELRVKYSDNPLKFIESEADLDEEIKNMLTASDAPELYPNLVELGTHVSILSLLSHENTDISIAAVELLNELTDEELVTEASEAAEEGMKALVKALVESDALDLLVQNISRLNEDQGEDKQGVFNTMSVIENLISIDPSIAEVVVEKTSFLSWLLQRVRVKTFDSNRQYASEMLAILLQNSRPNRIKLGELGGVDTLLRVIAAYKRKDPKDPDEVELMENIFDVLCAALIEPEIKEKFLEGEGLELMILMLKEKKMSRMRALKVLDHAMLGADGASCCNHFVDILGLKTLFPAFMRKGMKKYKKEYKSFSEAEENEHLVSIISSLFKNVTEPASRARLMLKFEEADYEKVDRLVEMHKTYAGRVADADKEIEDRKKELEEEDLSDDEREAEEEELFLKRLTAGLFTLQLVDFIMASVCVEDKEGRIRDRITLLLEKDGQTLESIKTILKEYAENVGDGKGDNRENAERDRILGLVEAL